MDTLDFELEIGQGSGHTYPVTARAPGGEAAASMRLPLTTNELDHQVGIIKDAVLASSAIVRRLATHEEQPAQELGRLLFEALIADDVRGLYVASWRFSSPASTAARRSRPAVSAVSGAVGARPVVAPFGVPGPAVTREAAAGRDGTHRSDPGVDRLVGGGLGDYPRVAGSPPARRPGTLHI